jgi:hypothetical protein
LHPRSAGAHQVRPAGNKFLFIKVRVRKTVCVRPSPFALAPPAPQAPLLNSLGSFFSYSHLTTSRNHESKPKNPTIRKGGQGLVVVRVFSSPYGPGTFPYPSAIRHSISHFFSRVFRISLTVSSACGRWDQSLSTLPGTFCHLLGSFSKSLTPYDRNAGGRTSDLTAELVKTCQSTIGLETCMHLTCTNMPSEKVDIALQVRVLPLVRCLAYVLAGSEAVRLS